MMKIEEAIERLSNRYMVMSMCESLEEVRRENEALDIAIDCMKTIIMISNYEPELEWDDDMYVAGRNSMLNDIQEDIKDIWGEVE